MTYDSGAIIDSIESDIAEANSQFDKYAEENNVLILSHGPLVDEEDKIWKKIEKLGIDKMDDIPADLSKKLKAAQKKVDSSRMRLGQLTMAITKTHEKITKLNDPNEYHRRVSIELEKLQKKVNASTAEKKPPNYKVNKEGMRVRKCRNCNEEFTQIIKRGKPFENCETCREEIANKKINKVKALKVVKINKVVLTLVDKYKVKDNMRIEECAVCSKEFAQEIKRGRPATKCEECRVA